ncbi:MAG: hypothetical protein PHI18_07270 [bacterium]|nr:hypothetical protein [bacterium]
MNPQRTISILAICALGWLASAASVAAPRNELIDLRVGRHKSFDRVVFEFPAEMPREISVLSEHRVQVRFPQGTLRADFAVPRLPENLAVISGLQASRMSDQALVVDIFLKRAASPSELPLAGETWRLAMDLAPSMSEKPAEKPEYIPGDRPIPTTFAAKSEPQAVPESPPTPEISKPAETPHLALTPQAEDPLADAAQIHSVLAYFFLSRGDTEDALAEARSYSEITGSPLAAFDVSAETMSGIREHSSQAKLRLLFLTWPWALAVMFGAGLLAGLVLWRVLPKRPIRLKLPRLPKLKLETRRKIVESDPTEELEADLHALDTAIAEEPPRRAKSKTPEIEPEDEPVPQQVVDEEKEAKETLMDRRVRRVLELNKEGRTVAAIAEELEMNQDEVKLILDLNR